MDKDAVVALFAMLRNQLDGTAAACRPRPSICPAKNRVIARPIGPGKSPLQRTAPTALQKASAK